MRKGIVICAGLFMVPVALFSLGSARAAPANAKGPRGSPYLFVWAGGEDRLNSDFLAVIDARRESPNYGQVISTASVNEAGTMPHHTEYEFPKGRLLFANGWAGNKTFLLDLTHPTSPRVKGSFASLAGYSFPHSFVRLPNGHVLATFQGKGAAYAPPGALLELDELELLLLQSSHESNVPCRFIEARRYDRTTTDCALIASNVAPSLGRRLALAVLPLAALIVMFAVFLASNPLPATHLFQATEQAKGGAAPTAGCDASHLSEQARMRYSAKYQLFSVAK
jgi:hypothetical protein